MDSDAILSFHTPGREVARVTCTSSPVMELVYAQFYLQRRLHHPRGFEVPWAAPLLHADPDVGIAWPLPPEHLSDKDRQLPNLADLPHLEGSENNRD